jgi:hypothetical protein
VGVEPNNTSVRKPGPLSIVQYSRSLTMYSKGIVDLSCISFDFLNGERAKGFDLIFTMLGINFFLSLLMSHEMK